MTYTVQIGGKEYAAKYINFHSKDRRYHFTDAVDVCLALSYEEAKAIFSSPGTWSLLI